MIFYIQKYVQDWKWSTFLGLETLFVCYEIIFLEWVCLSCSTRELCCAVCPGSVSWKHFYPFLSEVLFLFAMWVGFLWELLCSLLLFAAIMNIVLSQPCGKIFVGDPHQQIYTFRGAVNALFTVPHTHVFYLTQVRALFALKSPEAHKQTLWFTVLVFQWLLCVRTCARFVSVSQYVATPCFKAVVLCGFQVICKVQWFL